MSVDSLAVGTSGADRGSRLFQEKGEHDRQRHAVEQRLERGLVVLERHLARAAADRQQHPAEHRPEQRAEREVQKLTTPVAVPLISGGLASLMTV